MIKEKTMAFKMACAETGANCPFEVQTGTREEAIAHIAVHVKAAHPEMAAKPPSPEMIDQLIHQV
jgi:predicted small metal-binding protein